MHVVKVTGEFDVAAVDGFHVQAGAPDAELVVVDLREATFLDSYALTAIVELHERLRGAGRSLAVLRPNGYADRIFKLTGMDAQLPLYDERVPVLAQFNYG